MKQVIGKDGTSRVLPLSQKDIDIIAADVLAEANRDPIAEREARIDEMLNANPEYALMLEAVEDALGMNRGQLIANVKAKAV